MSIKEEYINVVKHDLKTLRKNLRDMDGWKIEIGVLEEKINAYKKGGLGLGIQSNSTITIDDIVDRDETRLNTLKSNIDHTNYKLREYESYLKCLNNKELFVIKKKYFENLLEEKISDEKIAREINYTGRVIGKWRNSAIRKIAEYKYGVREVI